MHKLDDEAGSIAKTMHVISNFCGYRPKGWFGPGLTQTFDTIDHLASNGIEYIGDCVLDDQPVWVKTKTNPIAALPYNYEIHDIVLMAIQHHESNVYKKRSLDYFETIYEESEENIKVMALAMHPYLSGSPHRIKYVRQTFEEILSKPGVICWDGVQILEISASPTSNDVVGLQDLYLQLDISNSNFETVVDEISSGLDPSASNYVVSSSYANGNLVRSGGPTTTTSTATRSTATTSTTATTASSGTSVSSSGASGGTSYSGTTTSSSGTSTSGSSSY